MQSPKAGKVSRRDVSESTSPVRNPGAGETVFFTGRGLTDRDWIGYVPTLSPPVAAVQIRSQASLSSLEGKVEPELRRYPMSERMSQRLRSAISNAATPAEAVMACTSALASTLPGSLVTVWCPRDAELLCVAAAGGEDLTGRRLRSASLPDLFAGHETSTVTEFDCPPELTCTGLTFAASVSVGTNEGQILLLTGRPIESLARRYLRDTANYMALPLRWRQRTDSSVHFSQELLHDCLGELTVILSSSECLESYGEKWDEIKKRRYYAKIRTAGDKLRTLIARDT